MNFISPKNFKSGRLIANKFTSQDLILLVAGIIASFVLELLYFSNFLNDSITINLAFACIFALPGGVVLLLVMPFGVYHNVRTFLKLLLMYINRPKKYVWGGLMRNANKYEETEETN